MRNIITKSAPNPVSTFCGEDHFQLVAVDQIYIMSKYLGVSYRALLIQLRYNLKFISESQFRALENNRFGEIKKGLSQSSVSGEVFVVGNWWRSRAIDVVVGDLIVTDSPALCEGDSILNVVNKQERHEFIAETPGIAKVSNENGWSAFVRVSRKGFAGMYQFRHEEEVE